MFLYFVSECSANVVVFSSVNVLVFSKIKIHFLQDLVFAIVVLHDLDFLL